MKRQRRTLFMVFFATLLSVVLTAWFLSGSNSAAAQQPPPPPPGTPTNTPVTPPTLTNTPVTPPTLTNTPVTPTDTPVTPPTSTNTPVMPTDTPTPYKPPIRPTSTPRPTRTREPGPNPDCQSSIEGYVSDAAGQRVAGATVIIQGEGWSSGALTDESGHFGFAGLCAGTVTLQVTLPDGQTGPVTTVSLDGHNSVHLDLSLSPAGASTPGGTATGQQTPTPEPSMPTTGYPGWLLAGGALLGALLLLSAGARRAFRAREGTQSQD